MSNGSFPYFSEFPRLKRLRSRALGPLTMPPLSIMPSALHWCHDIHRLTERRNIVKTRTSHAHVSKTIPNFLQFHRYDQAIFSTLMENIVIGNLKGPHHTNLPISDIQDTTKFSTKRHDCWFHTASRIANINRKELLFLHRKSVIFSLSATYHTFNHVCYF